MELQYFKKENEELIASFSFKDFIEAWSFMTATAMVAEKLNHHPFWTNVYNKVEVKLSTHDAGNIVTEKDYELAKKIESIYNRNR